MSSNGNGTKIKERNVARAMGKVANKRWERPGRVQAVVERAILWEHLIWNV